MDIITTITTMLPGLGAGAGGAATSFLGVFRDVRSRLGKLEKALGDPESEPPTGIYYTLDSLTKSIRTLRNEIDSWRDSPPDWLVRIVSRAANRGSMTNEHWSEFEQRIESRLNSFKVSLQRLEDDLDTRERRLQDEIGRSSPDITGIVMRDEYDRDSKRRAEEMGTLRENLKSANSFLRGVMAAMGYVDPAPPSAPSTPPPPPPPRPAPRVKLPTPARPFIPPYKPPTKK